MGANLPFKIGDEAELKSFLSGYRSAWFRCKIKDIGLQKGHVVYRLEFFDYPDEKVKWTRIYQKLPQQSGQLNRKRDTELVIRHSFPPIYREGHLPDSLPTDVIAIACDSWKVGDLVDWWRDGCYWSGRVAKLLEGGKISLELPEPPIGEGGSYDADFNDLRPSLSWSPQNDWTLPIPKGSGNWEPCVQVVYPNNKGTDVSMELDRDGSIEKIKHYISNTSRSNHEVKDTSDLPQKVSSKKDHSSSEPIERSCINERNQISLGNNAVATTLEPFRKDESSTIASLEKLWISEKNYWSSVRLPDTIESSILELEELTHKIRWLKDLLRFELGWSIARKPSWRFLDNSVAP